METNAKTGNDYRFTLVKRSGAPKMRIRGTRHDVVTEFKVVNALLFARKYGSQAAAKHLADNGVPFDLARRVLLRMVWRSTDEAERDE